MRLTIFGGTHAALTRREQMANNTYIHSASDLAAFVRQLRPDAVAAGLDITTDWCREQMHALGYTRYEDIDAVLLATIADRVDELAH